MNATIPTLLIVATVATGAASQAQKANQPRERVASSRVPVDVSLQGLGDVSGLALGDAARGGSAFATPSVGSVSPLAFSCAPSIRDQAAGGCLMASSIPTPGLLFPPPHDGGKFNVASGALSFVGGGAGNTATGDFATVAGGGGDGLGNTASADFATVGIGDTAGKTKMLTCRKSYAEVIPELLVCNDNYGAGPWLFNGNRFVNAFLLGTPVKGLDPNIIISHGTCAEF